MEHSLSCVRVVDSLEVSCNVTLHAGAVLQLRSNSVSFTGVNFYKMALEIFIRVPIFNDNMYYGVINYL